MAVDFLVKKGYILLHQNWRYRHKEVDLIMTDAEWLVIVEVKTRRGLGFGFPEESVTTAKQAFLQEAAEAYFEANAGFEKVRFDVMSIILDERDNAVEMLHLEDAF